MEKIPGPVRRLAQGFYDSALDGYSISMASSGEKPDTSFPLSPPVAGIAWLTRADKV